MSSAVQKIALPMVMEPPAKVARIFQSGAICDDVAVKFCKWLQWLEDKIQRPGNGKEIEDLRKQLTLSSKIRAQIEIQNKIADNDRIQKFGNIADRIKLDKPIVFYDLETAGIEGKAKYKIVEFFGIKYYPDGIKEERYFKLNPKVPIQKKAFEKHGIDDVAIQDCPTFKDKAQEIQEFFGDSHLGGYNIIGFDNIAIQKEFSEAGINFSVKDKAIIDAMYVYHKNIPYVEGEERKLKDALEYYCSKTMEKAHRAEIDVLTTLEVLEGQFKMYNEKNQPSNVYELSDYCKREHYDITDFVDLDGKFVWDQGEVVFNFGKKHMGETLAEVAVQDKGYLYWILKDEGFSQEVKELVRGALQGLYIVKEGNEILPPRPVTKILQSGAVTEEELDNFVNWIEANIKAKAEPVNLLKQLLPNGKATEIAGRAIREVKNGEISSHINGKINGVDLAKKPTISKKPILGYFEAIDKPLVFFEISKAGWDTFKHKITEISVIKYNLDGTRQNKTWRLDPEKPIQQLAKEKYGISDEDVKGKLKFADIAKELSEYFKGSHIVGFNLEFDLKVLSKEFEAAGIKLDLEGIAVVDPCSVYQSKVKQVNGYPRDRQAAHKYYCGEEVKDEKNITARIAATVNILKGQFDMYMSLTRNIYELSKYCQKTNPSFVDPEGKKFVWSDKGELVFNFYKEFRGKRLKDVIQSNPEIIDWIINADFPEDTKTLLKNAKKGIFPEPPLRINGNGKY